MKQFYATALAAAVALTASAASLEKQAAATPLTAKHQAVELASEVKATAASSLKAPAKAATKADALGSFMWNYKGLLQGQGEEVCEVTIKEDPTTTDGLLINGLFASVFNEAPDFKAKFVNGTIQIPYQKLVYNERYAEWVTFVADVLDASGEVNLTETAVLTLTYSDGAWKSDQIYCLVGRTEAGAFTNADGWYALAEGATMAKDKSTVYEDAEWTGNFLAGIFQGTSAVTEPALTTVKYNPATKCYTITDALSATYAQKGWDEESPSCTVDATDPANCVVPDFTTGINGGDVEGIYYLLSQTANTNDPSTVAEEFRIKVTEDANTITIVFPVKSMFLWPSNTTKLYYANSAAESKLVIKKDNAGINDIEIDETNAPATFYNLQGQRVANPTSGIFVKVQAGKATKVAL